MISKIAECLYCGIRTGTHYIENPNIGEGGDWWVCDKCDECINLQQNLTFDLMLKDMLEESNKEGRLTEQVKKLDTKIIEAEKRIDELGGISLTLQRKDT